MEKNTVKIIKKRSGKLQIDMYKRIKDSNGPLFLRKIYVNNM